MATKILDLNNVERSVMDLTFMDEARTTLTLKIPTEDLVNELENMGPELAKMKTGDRDAVDLIYGLAARLISCNRDFVEVTAAELRDKKKYRMDLESLLIFVSNYMDFISSIANQKN